MSREADLATTLGVSRAALRAIRDQHLVQDSHWTYEGSHVVILPAGLEELRRHLPGARTTETATEAPTETPLVVLRPTQNPRIVLVRPAEQPEARPARLRVRDGARFVRGMRVSGRVVPGMSDLFELVGRQPRFRGRF